MVTQHSKQIPMPQSGARGAPLTDLRKAVTPASATAVETMAPAGAVTTTPLTVSFTVSDMRRLLEMAAGQVRLDGNRGGTPEQSIRHQPGRGE